MPRTFDDVAIQMAFSERSSRMRTGVVDGVEGPVDIKQGNPDPLDFDGPSGPRRNFSTVATVINSGMALILLLGRVAKAISTFRRVVSDLISTEVYGIQKDKRSKT